MNCSYFKRFLCFVLSIATVFSIFAICAPAKETEIDFTVECNNTTYTLNLVVFGNEWYVKANDLALLADTEVKESNGGISFYKKSPYVFLYTVGSNNCKKHNSSYYVPLQNTSSKIGVRFYLHGNTPKAEVLRTPQQLLAEVNIVFSDSRLPLNQIVSTGIYGAAENMARLWAMMPFVGSGSIIGAITGKDEYDRYREVITTMISDGGSMSDFMATCADFDGEIKKYADVLGKAAKLTQKGSSLYNALLSKGISEELLNALAYEYNPYEHDLSDFLKGYASVAKIIDIQYILDVFAYYAAVVDMDESTLLCMQKVFNNSGNKYTRKATQTAIDLRFGSANVAIADIYSGAVENIIINGIDKVLEEKLSGGFDNEIGLWTFVGDEAFHISDTSDALIYMSICASLQNDIINYYNTRKNESAYDMRAISIMYLKTTLVAYDYLEFDKGLGDTVEIAKSTINSYLDNIFGYADTEYSPNYDNSEIITYLNKNYNIDTNVSDSDNSSGNVSEPENNSSEPDDTSEPEEGEKEDVSSNESTDESDDNSSQNIVASGKCGLNVTWQLDDIGTMTIIGTGRMSDFDYDSVSWYSYRNDITSVIVLDGVSYIGNYAFYNCAKLVNIELPDTIETIGRDAFCNCDSLMKITIPSSVNLIRSGAFSECDNLKSINVDSLNSSYVSVDGVLFNKNKDRLIAVPAGKAGTYIVPSEVKYIDERTFGYCKNLSSITLPDGITSISSYMFVCCTSLSSITIPNSVTSIGGYAFNDCKSLKSISIPDSVTFIDYGAFDGCESLQSIIIPDGVTSISFAMFEKCYSLTSVTIPSSVKSIGEFAFNDCNSLVSIIIPDGVTAIGQMTFLNCHNLKSVTIPNSVTSIGYVAFGRCWRLTDVYYSGSESDWNKINIDSQQNEDLINATIHYHG